MGSLTSRTNRTEPDKHEIVRETHSRTDRHPLLRGCRVSGSPVRRACPSFAGRSKIQGGCTMLIDNDMRAAAELVAP